MSAALSRDPGMAAKKRAIAFRHLQARLGHLTKERAKPKASVVDEIRLMDYLDRALVEFDAADSRAMNNGAATLSYIDARDPLFGLDAKATRRQALDALAWPSKALALHVGDTAPGMKLRYPSLFVAHCFWRLKLQLEKLGEIERELEDLEQLKCNDIDPGAQAVYEKRYQNLRALELASTFAVVNFVCGFVKADRAAQQDGFVSGAELRNHTPAEVQGILNEASRHMYDFERREPRRWKRYIGPPLPKAKPATKATARKAVA